MRTQIVLRGQIFLSTQKFLLDFLLFVSKKFFSALNRSFLFPKRLILAVDLHFINWLPLVDIMYCLMEGLCRLRPLDHAHMQSFSALVKTAILVEP
jgi:hypothetical protein